MSLLTNETINHILDRRSIRAYKPEAIPADVVETLLTAAVHAPTARNSQPWQFIVIDDRAQLDKIVGLSPYTKMMAQAPLAILVAGMPEKCPGYWVDDCGAATQNILLAAKSLGLGSCWCGIHGTPDRCAEFGRVFGLPEGVVAYSVIALGYPNEEKPRAEGRLKPEIIHHNNW
ncbi:nitroreductase family protein [Merdimmobilis hominis]|uniref:nitroreductase family protein n=1 Tax=Merdimmobilis hominis TaxID=2897707 RepID=UPI0018994401|nr:nitroreductase family protein [Merdimmobilis hominis]